MKLDSNTINELVELLRPLMEDERNRRPFLALALGNDAPVLQRITWSGAVATFIPDMVCKLADYGEIAPGRQALWALLEYVRSQAGIDVQQHIDKLRPLINLQSPDSTSISAIPTDIPVSRNLQPSPWKWKIVLSVVIVLLVIVSHQILKFDNINSSKAPASNPIGSSTPRNTNSQVSVLFENSWVTIAKADFLNHWEEKHPISRRKRQAFLISEEKLNSLGITTARIDATVNWLGGAWTNNAPDTWDGKAVTCFVNIQRHGGINYIPCQLSDPPPD